MVLGLVVAGRVEGEVPEELAGGVVDDSDVEVGDEEGEHPRRLRRSQRIAEGGRCVDREPIVRS